MVKITPSNSKYVVVGGAGFIGSHFVEYLLGFETVHQVVVIDNFSSGTLHHLSHVIDDERLEVQTFNIGAESGLSSLLPEGCTIIHLASNPDIAAAAVDPKIDFDQGTVLSNEVAEAARISGAARVLYASGSGVYGDYGLAELSEDAVAMRPVSTYGASKLAGEAIFCAYAYMFDIPAIAFRFGNVIGARQTHGVGFDFVRRLFRDSTELRVLGDGMQSKTYVHVSDIVQAVLTAEASVKLPFDVFNVGTDEYVTVNEIARIAIRVVSPTVKTELIHTGGKRGWKGDVPVLRLDTRKIRSIGWSNKYSTREALIDSMQQMLQEITS